MLHLWKYRCSRVLVGAALSFGLAGPAVGKPPKEFSMFFGQRVQICQGCHGAPPSLPHSDSASRIVATGAATKSGAEMRKLMGSKRLGIAMELVLADPDLTDDKLETIRLYLVKVRDGDAPAALEFPQTQVGTTSEPLVVTIVNERAARDPPATVASIRITGDYAMAPGSTCSANGPFKGESSCVVNVRFAPKSKGTRSGRLEFLFAPTPGLTPKARVTKLTGVGVSP